MSVQIQGLTARFTVSEPSVRGGTGLELYGAFGVYTLTLGTKTYVYVAAHEDHGLSVFTLGADGALTSVQNLSDSGSTTALELVGASQITSATLASGTYLYVNSAIDDGLSVFKVDPATGTLTSIQNVTDTAAIELNGPEGKMQVATVGGTTYLISPADDDDGIATWRINADGTLTNVYNLTDNATLQLHSASDAEVVQMGGHTYVYVAAEDDPGISVFELNANGSLTNIQNIHDDATLQLDGTAGLAVATVDGVTYVIASGAGVLNSSGVPQSPEGLSVFSVGPTGQLTNVFNLHDTAELGLFGAFGLTTFTIDTVTYVAASAITDDALSIFRVDVGGALTEVTTVFDSAGVTLDRSYFNDFVTVGGKHFLLATGRSDNGVTVFEVVLNGTSPTNGAPTDLTVQGGSVQENAAAGTVVGTLSATDPNAGDTFTYSISGESAPFTIVGNQIQVASGAGIDYETKTSYAVRITVTDSQGASYVEDFTIGVQDVNEGGANVILGTSAAETLTGTSGSDEIWGRDGGDTLRGLEGSDKLYGEGGNDTLDGGLGADTLVGGLGADTYQIDDAGDIITELAGQGVDWVRTTLTSYSLDTAANANIEHLNYSGPSPFTGTGNALSNTFLGGNYNDTFYGLGGNDLFKGLNGADTLTGGAGADDFVYMAVVNSLVGTGMDRILDFISGEDDLVVTSIDANTGLSGDQAFALDADGSFSAGEIRQRVDGTSLILEFNIDADSTVEMAIRLEGRTSPLASTDFDL